MSFDDTATLILARATREGDHPKGGGGGAPTRCPFDHANASAGTPSTALRAVPLPRSAGEDPAARPISGWWAFCLQASTVEARA